VLSYTWKQARAERLVQQKRDFRRAVSAARLIIEHNTRSGRPADAWQVPASAALVLTQPDAVAAEATLRSGLEKRAGPLLDDVTDELDAADEAIGQASEDRGVLVAREGGGTYGPDAARRERDRLTAHIKADEAVGIGVHRRHRGLLRLAAALAPYLEVAATLTWLAALWNVNVLRPDKPLVFVTTIVITLVCAATVAVAARQAGLAHNQARELAAEGSFAAAEPMTTRRNAMAVITGLLGVVLTAALLIRAIEALDVPDRMWWNLAVVAALCVVTGMAMPGVAYLFHAIDGSSVSRLRDELARWRVDIEDDQADRLHLAQAHLDEARRTMHTLVTVTLDSVCRDTIVRLCASQVVYRLALTQVCAATAPEPTPPTVFEGTATNTQIARSISCGVPDAALLDLQPLIDTWHRVVSERRRETDLRRSLSQVARLRLAA